MIEIFKKECLHTRNIVENIISAIWKTVKKMLFKKMKIKLPYDSSISLVDIWQTEMKVICGKIAVLTVANT